MTAGTYILTPRPTYRGRAVRPEALEHAGQSFDLVPLWTMDDSGPYPGEVAMGRADSKPLYGSTMWIASGDLTKA